MKKVIVIVGPTASGKSALAIKLAKSLHGEIINGDSVQVYKGLDIGSAKIKKEEMNGVKHHLLDIKALHEPYSVFHFQQDARALMNDVDVPMIVGGTGLYIKAALYDYEFDDPKRDQAFEKEYAQISDDSLREKVKILDPKLDVETLNRRRLLRALFMATYGTPRSGKQGKDTPLFEPLIIYLDIDRDILESRLIKRLDVMLSEGLLKEVEDIYKQNITLNVIGYRELLQYFNQEMTLDEAKYKIVKRSRSLAKRQKTWFKNQMDVHVLDALDDHLFTKALKLCEDFIKEK